MYSISAATASATAVTAAAPRPTVCGLPRRTFWAVAAVLLVGLVVGGTLGGILGRRSTDTNTAPQGHSGTSDPPATPKNGTAIAVAARTDTTPADAANADPDSGFVLIYQTAADALYFVRVKRWQASTPEPLGRDFDAKPHSPLVALSYVPVGTVPEVQLFYVNRDGHLADAVLAGDRWTAGKLSEMELHPLASSRLAACVWYRETLDALWPEVYFQTGDRSVAAYRFFNNNWVTASYPNGNDVVHPRAGSALAALFDMADSGDGNGTLSQHLRVYSQGTEGAIMSRDFFAGKWSTPYTVYRADHTISDIGIVARRTANTTLERFSLLFSASASAEVGDDADADADAEIGADARAGPLHALTWTNDTAFASAPEVIFAGRARAAVAGVNPGADASAAYFQLRNETDLRQARLSDAGVWSVTAERIGAPDSSSD